MISECARLLTRSDARQFADALLTGISSRYYDYDKAVEILTEWIWDNKPEHNSLIKNHPVNGMNFDDFWDIISAAEL